MAACIVVLPHSRTSLERVSYHRACQTERLGDVLVWMPNTRIPRFSSPRDHTPLHRQGRCDKKDDMVWLVLIALFFRIFESICTSWSGTWSLKVKRSGCLLTNQILITYLQSFSLLSKNNQKSLVEVRLVTRGELHLVEPIMLTMIS